MSGSIAVLPATHPLAADGSVSLAEIAAQGLVWFPESQIRGSPA